MESSKRFAPLFLFAAVLAAYFNAFAGAFQFDDYNVIVHNAAVHSASAWLDSMPGIRPLLKLSYTLNWIAGPGPLGFHVVNVATHAANAVLVYRLLCVVGDKRGAGDWSPFLAALLFALHPVQTEAVTYICGRSTSLMALFYLASVLAYLRADDSASPQRQRAWSAVLFAAALLIKETAVTLPLALLLLDATDVNRRRTLAEMLRRQSGHWLVLLVGAVITASSPSYRHLLEVSMATRGTWENLLSQLNAVWYLAGQLLMPGRLNADPDLPVMTSLTTLLALQALLLAGVVVFGLRSLRRRPWAAVAILWFFLHLAPTNSLLPRLDLANDRQLYLAAIGPFMIVGTMFQLLLDRVPRPAAVNAVVGLMLLGAGFATVQRNEVYRSEVAFWQDVAAKSPRKPRVFNNLGYVYQQASRFDEARLAYLRAIELDPDYWKARINLSTLPEENLPRERAD